MTTNILSPNWTGDTASPLDPTAMRFKAIQAPSFGNCDGCLFIGQRSNVCNLANALAAVAGAPDCDQVLTGPRRTVIYVADDSDPRQLPLLGGEH